MPSLVPLVETLRGGTPECVHFGALAVADAQGRLVAQAGDPHWVTFTRSTLKPLQALAQLGWLDDEQREALRPWRHETIASIRGTPVGERRAVFRLQAGV